jgi:PhnB protein
VRISIEDIRRQYAGLSDDGLLEIDREDLMEQARMCYDEEVARRGLMAVQTGAPHRSLAGQSAAGIEEMVVAGTYQTVDQAIQAQELLRGAGIPARLTNDAMGGVPVMVPASALESARELLTPPSDLSYIRHGMGAVRPYLFGRLDLLDFVCNVFGAVELERTEFGPLAFHVEVMIGDSVVVLELSDPPHESATTGQTYLYVADVDATYRAAIEAGAVKLAAPVDKPYEERSAGVKDSFGNTWWISTYTGA